MTNETAFSELLSCRGRSFTSPTLKPSYSVSSLLCRVRSRSSCISNLIIYVQISTKFSALVGRSVPISETHLPVHHYASLKRRGRDSKVCFLRRELCDKVKRGRVESREVRGRSADRTAIKSKHSRIKTYLENFN